MSAIFIGHIKKIAISELFTAFAGAEEDEETGLPNNICAPMRQLYWPCIPIWGHEL